MTNYFLNRFLLHMYSKGSCTGKQIQEVVESVDTINTTSMNRLASLLDGFLKTLPANFKADNPSLDALQDAFDQCQNLMVDLRTEKQRMRHFTRKGFIQAVSYRIGTRVDARADGTEATVDATAQYVPVISMLTKYKDHYTTLPIRTHAGKISSYFDTHRYRTSAYHCAHPTAMKLTLYHDDIEVGNVLGARAGVYKMTMFYYTVHGQSSSRLQSIHLAIVCHASDLKQYGYASVLKPLIDDLKLLYGGVDVGLRGVPDIIHATLEHVVGDNLAANALLGMNQSFRAGHFCRFCYISGAEVPCSTRASDHDPRCRISHQLDVEMVQHIPEFSTRTGVKQSGALDQLPYFWGVESTVPDIM